MSYILDALKKADAERERSLVPGLHAHPQDGLSIPVRRSLPWPALAIGMIVLLGGALVWVLLSDNGVRTPPLVVAAPATPLPPAVFDPPAAAPTPPPAPLAAPVATPTPTPEAAPPVAAPAPAVPTATPAPAPAPARAPATAPTATPTPPAPATAAAPAAPPAGPARPAPAAAKATPAPVAPKPAPAPEPRVPSLAELPADVRAGVPALAISGAVYSPTPSARMLFISGQVLREGDAVADGVVVERIGASASVLSVRGQRFQINH